ncbi:MAG: ATPase/histidine kinase/DNA gyrase B/HSP90 domain-containing protein, partial [bacterium]
VRLPLGSGHLSREQMVTPPIADAPPSRGRLRSEGPPVDEAPDTTGEEAVDEEDAADIGEADRTVILVVDDNAEIRAFLRKHLKEDYRVVEAADGEEGLEMARREVPDLVLSDVMMPRMDGYAFCRALKADPETSFVPLILLTARGSEESRIHGLELGADDFLTKPFNRRELLVRVRNLIDSRKRLRGALPAAGWASPLSPDVPSADQELLARIRSVIESRMEDEDFSVPACALERGSERADPPHPAGTGRPASPAWGRQRERNRLLGRIQERLPLQRQLSGQVRLHPLHVWGTRQGLIPLPGPREGDSAGRPTPETAPGCSPRCASCRQGCAHPLPKPLHPAC